MNVPFGLSTQTVIIGAIVGAAIGYGIYAAVDEGEDKDRVYPRNYTRWSRMHSARYRLNV
ncbi:MAG: hypothetical protein A3H91_17480 [Gammaproteobacteria bacterium RIFCSPLOWO2_02_FULL_61_13]|nr:MAG: hypothetical protein A3H91_17480 [Gammaproteobacteria bacterium RIFCSPLOWO2_02_FULL_61_13]